MPAKPAPTTIASKLEESLSAIRAVFLLLVVSDTGRKASAGILGRNKARGKSYAQAAFGLSMRAAPFMLSDRQGGKS